MAPKRAPSKAPTHQPPVGIKPAKTPQPGKNKAPPPAQSQVVKGAPPAKAEAVKPVKDQTPPSPKVQAVQGKVPPPPKVQAAKPVKIETAMFTKLHAAHPTVVADGGAAKNETARPAKGVSEKDKKIEAAKPAKTGKPAKVEAAKIVKPAAVEAAQVKGVKPPKMEAPIPAKVESAKPVKTEGPKPVKVETRIPAKVEVPIPAKVDAVKPVKVEESRPVKVETRKPAKVEAVKPAKVEEPRPAKAETKKPANVEAVKPVKVEEPRLAKVETTKPARAGTAKPTKIEEPKPAKVEAAKPIRLEESKPAKVETTKPAKAETPKPTKIKEPKPAKVEAAAKVETTKPAKAETAKPTKIEATKPPEVVELIPAKVEAAKPKKGKSAKSTSVEAAEPATDEATKPAKPSKPRARPSKPAAPPPPAHQVALSRLAPRSQPAFSTEECRALEEEFGWNFSEEARCAMEALARFDLLAGVGKVLTLDQMRKYNALGNNGTDAIAWTTRRLGLFAVAMDAQDNRFCLDVGDPKGLAPVYIASPKLGLAAGAMPVFPQATDLIAAFATYTAGTEARAAEADVVRLTAELKELRQRRPSPQAGRNEALARLASMFGGAPKAADAAPAPGAEEESRLAGALEQAQNKYKTLWMPFVEQFARWPIYWNLLWNGPGALNANASTLDAPLLLAWREVLPLGQAVAAGRTEQLSSELANRQPVGRAALAVAEAYSMLGDAQASQAALARWDGSVLGPLPPLAKTLGQTPSDATKPAVGELDWPSALKLPRSRAERFLVALGAQLAADLKRHGTANILGATKAAVRPAGGGRMLVEAGLGHVPLEVRKALFAGKPVVLSGQFLKGLTRDLCKRLHEPTKDVERTLTRLRGVLEEHINAHANLTIPHVASFRVKNEPSPTGAARLYLIVDAAQNLVDAAQSAVLHNVSQGVTPEESPTVE